MSDLATSVNKDTRSTVARDNNKKQVTHSNLYADDIYFFTKRQVKLGTILSHHGRLDPGSRWEVVKIVTIIPAARKRYKVENVEMVMKLNDTVHLRRIGSPNEIRQATFGYLSYSVLWRILGNKS